MIIIPVLYVSNNLQHIFDNTIYKLLWRRKLALIDSFHYMFHDHFLRTPYNGFKLHL